MWAPKQGRLPEVPRSQGPSLRSVLCGEKFTAHVYLDLWHISQRDNIEHKDKYLQVYSVAERELIRIVENGIVSNYSTASSEKATLRNWVFYLKDGAKTAFTERETER